MDTAARGRLRELLLERAVKHGNFVLASGKSSSYFIDSKKVLLYSESLSLIARLMWELTRDDALDGAGGLEVGAIPLVTALALEYHRHGRQFEGFFIRKRAKDHGTRERVEGVLKRQSRVAILDDVLTTGSSAMQAVEEVERAGAKVTQVVCIVDRLEGAAELLAPRPVRPIFTARDLGLLSANSKNENRVAEACSITDPIATR